MRAVRSLKTTLEKGGRRIVLATERDQIFPYKTFALQENSMSYSILPDNTHAVVYKVVPAAGDVGQPETTHCLTPGESSDYILNLLLP